MFGGLELKKGGAAAAAAAAAAASVSETNKEAVPAPLAPPAPAAAESNAVAAPSSMPGSAFSFLSSSSVSASVPASVPAAADAGPASVSASASASAFSFLSLSWSTDPAAATTTTTTTTKDAPAPPAASSSGFGFINRQSPTPAEASGFSFMMAPTPAASEVPATTTTVSDAPPSVTSTNSDSMSAPPILDTSLPPSSSTTTVMGSGQTFASAMAVPTTTKGKKRRTRTTAIGAAAQQQQQQQQRQRHAASLPSSAVNSEIPEPLQSPSAATREEAVKASQRAEDFMARVARSSMQSPSLAASSRKPPPIPTKTDIDARKDVGGDDNEDEDDIVVQAKAAAEEAQKQNVGRKGGSSWLGGLMRTTGARQKDKASAAQRKPSIGNGSIGNGSQHSSSSSLNYSNNNNNNNNTNSNSNSNNKAATTSADQEEQAQRQVEEKQTLQPLDVTYNRSSSYQQPVDLPTTVTSSSTISKPPVQPQPPALEALSSQLQLQPQPPLSSFLFRSDALPPAKPPQKKNKQTTARDEFDALMETFRTKVQQAMEQLKQLRKHKTELLEERLQAAANERLAVSKKEQAEAQQLAAVEAEDFDLADRMNTVIEQVEAERLDHVRILENITRAFQQLHQQKQALVDNVITSFADIQDSLQSFLKNQQDSDTAGDNAQTIMAQFEKVSKQISAEQERLQQDWKHLERDIALVEQERKELEAAISQQAGEYERLRDQARAKVKLVEQEMEDLRQLLAKKQEEVARLRTEAAGHDEAVLKVRVKFSRQLGRVQTKEMTLQDHRDDWDSEQAALQKQKEAHQAVVQQHHQALLDRDSLLASLNMEIQMADKFKVIVANEIQFDILAHDGTGDSNDDDDDDDDALVQETLVNCQAAVTEAKEVLQATEASLQALQNEEKQIQLRLPQLEDIKTAAAAKRDFKCAGKASKEIKELQLRLENLRITDLPKAQERNKAAAHNLTAKEDELQHEQRKATERQRATAVAHMHKLAQHIAKLEATRQSVCSNSQKSTSGSDNDETAAAAAASDASIQAVGAYVLQAQMEALRLEGEAIGQKYGGWTELLQEVGLTEQSDTTSTKQATNVPQEEAGESRKATLEEPNQQPQHQDKGTAKAEAMMQFRQLTMKLEETNAAIETAVAKEDYEKAAELDELLQELLQQIQSLDLDDDEMALALSSTNEGDDIKADIKEEVVGAETNEEKLGGSVTIDTGKEPVVNGQGQGEQLNECVPLHAQDGVEAPNDGKADETKDAGGTNDGTLQNNDVTAEDDDHDHDKNNNTTKKGTNSIDSSS